MATCGIDVSSSTDQSRPSTVLVIAAIVVGIALASITPEDASGDDDPPLRLLRRALALADVEDDPEAGAAAPGAADAADAPAAAVEDGGAALGDSPRPILGLVLVLIATLAYSWPGRDARGGAPAAEGRGGRYSLVPSSEGEDSPR